MEWKEIAPLPEECRNCKEEDCYLCDAAGKRWICSKEDELMANRKQMERAVQRLQRKIARIDAELEKLRSKD